MAVQERPEPVLPQVLPQWNQAFTFLESKLLFFKFKLYNGPMRLGVSFLFIDEKTQEKIMMKSLTELAKINVEKKSKTDTAGSLHNKAWSQNKWWISRQKIKDLRCLFLA